MTDLDHLRNRIRRIDAEVLRLVAERTEVARTIGEAKRSAGIPLRDFEVERQVLDGAAGQGEALGLPGDAVRTLIQHLITISWGEQERASYSAYTGAVESVAVIGGRGRMGRWLAGFFENQGHRVTVVDRAEQDPVGAVLDAAITFVATPPEAIPGIIDALTGAGYEGVVCDIASLKHHLRPAVDRAIAAGVSITSIHPMFGPGVRTLSDRVICICDCGDSTATRRVASLFSDTAATLVPLDFEGHDRIVSYVLGLSHLINLLFAKVLSAGPLEFAEIDRVGSTTFRSQVETTGTVIREDPDLYFGIQALNPFTPELYDDLRREFEQLAAWIRDGDREAFASMMERSRRWLSG